MIKPHPSPFSALSHTGSLMAIMHYNSRSRTPAYAILLCHRVAGVARRSRYNHKSSSFCKVNIKIIGCQKTQINIDSRFISSANKIVFRQLESHLGLSTYLTFSISGHVMSRSAGVDQILSVSMDLYFCLLLLTFFLRNVIIVVSQTSCYFGETFEVLFFFLFPFVYMPGRNNERRKESTGN